MSRLPWGPLAAVVATAVLLVGGATASRASWEASTAIGSSTSVAAATIPSVGTVTAKRTDGTLGFTVAVSWTAVAVEGVPVRGYEVARYVTPLLGTPTRTPGSGACDALLTVTSCVDTGSLLGLGGALTYIVTPVFATNWRGTPVTSNTA
ncbi:hypothetical protein [Klenkia terrae]|uniref:Uncharacterized protein n=1 Tax=Klenkia terrae TaxID=1052259 RepID=A0ABU8E8Y2_9ACTN|nr:hypothetical protein [Klenkia terrae]